MRKRVARKIEKRLQRLISSPRGSVLRARCIASLRNGQWRDDFPPEEIPGRRISAYDALMRIVGEARYGRASRAMAANLLSASGRREGIDILLGQFFQLKESGEIQEMGLTLELTHDFAVICPLIGALRDENPHRRQAAARALGWSRVPRANRKSVRALIRVLSGPGQPLMVRCEAAESLAYLDHLGAIPALISVLKESDAQLRFWSVFALGSISSLRGFETPDSRVVAALESVLGDEEVAPGYWSVGREALAMLGVRCVDEAEHAQQFREELARVEADAKASAEERRWAECYGGWRDESVEHSKSIVPELR